MKTIESDSNLPPELLSDKGWLLRLYVTMQTPKSIIAYSYLKEACEQKIVENYDIELINLLRNPQLDHDHQILPTASLVKKLPELFRKIIEDLYSTDKVLVGMDLVQISKSIARTTDMKPSLTTVCK